MKRLLLVAACVHFLSPSASAQTCITVEVRTRAEACEAAGAVLPRSRPPAGQGGARADAATALLADAIDAHGRAEGSGAEESRRLIEHAEGIYRQILGAYPDLDALDLSGLPANVTAPSLFGVRYYQAEALWRLEEWERCAEAFDSVARLSPEPDAAYTAVLCHNAAQNSQRSQRRRRTAHLERTLEARPFSPPEAQMAAALRRLICVVPEGPESPMARYRLGRLHYEANHFALAAAHFELVVQRHAESESAPFAAQLLLDSLHTLGTHSEAPRRECLRAMRDQLEPLERAYCAASEDREDLCEVLGRLQCAFQRHDAEALGEQGRHEEAAAAYLDLAERQSTCPGTDEALYNAAMHLEGAGDVMGAIEVRTRLRDQYPSALGMRAHWQLALNYETLGVYARAADEYTRFAQRFPGEVCDSEASPSCPDAPEGLRRAIDFYIALRRHRSASAAVEVFACSYGRRSPAETAEVIGALGAFHGREERWRSAIAAYERLLRHYGDGLPPDVTIGAHVAMARGHRARRRPGEAQEHLRRALSAWEATMAGGLRDEQVLYRCREAAAEAQYLLAESTRATFERGLRRRRGQSGPFVETQTAAFRQVESEYERVADFQSATWIIASARRVGEMGLGLAAAFEEMGARGDATLAPHMARLRADAEARLEFCFVTARNTRLFTEAGAACGERLGDAGGELVGPLLATPGAAQPRVVVDEPHEAMP